MSTSSPQNEPPSLEPFRVNRPPEFNELYNLWRWFSCKNPFYAISAALILWGLWISFGPQEDAIETWLLMGGLVGYTLLLSATAAVLVRWLNLWDDARTVLCLIVLMFLATSVTFDHVLVMAPMRGAGCCLVGLGMAIGVSESLLRGLRLRLPLAYRGPYYLILSLFFLYPLLVRSLLTPRQPLNEPGMWALFGFSTVAGLAFLTLLPAARRGEEAVEGNGSPWPWPLYPWSLFVILAIAVPGRAILLCWSLHSLDLAKFDRLVFGPYFLVPFGFAIAALLVELSRTLDRPAMARWMLFMPPAMAALAMVGHTPESGIYRGLRVLTISSGPYSAFDHVRLDPDPVYNRFLDHFQDRLGVDPLFATVVMSIAFFVYTAWRQVPGAMTWLTISLASMSVIATNSLRAGWLSPPEPGPFVAPALIQLFLAIRRTSPTHGLVAGMFLSAILVLVSPLPPGWSGPLFVHLVVATMLLCGAIFDDDAARRIRTLAAVSILALAVAVMEFGMEFSDPVRSYRSLAYSLFLGVGLTAYGRLLKHPPSFSIGLVLVGYWIVRWSWVVYLEIRTVVRGFDYLTAGAVFFLAATLVSLGKAGVLRRWMEARGWILPMESIDTNPMENSATR